MVKLDLKDRKILYQLDSDSRQSFRKIGRKVGLSKDVVASRVKKLEENGIILRFFTYYDILQLGLNFIRFYLKFQYVTPDIKKEIIDHFMNDDNVNNLFSTEGSYDLGVLMMVENISDIYPLWKKTLEKYDLLLVSSLPDFYVKKILGLRTSKKASESLEYLIGKMGPRVKINVVTSAHDTLIKKE